MNASVLVGRIHWEATFSPFSWSLLPTPEKISSALPMKAPLPLRRTGEATPKTPPAPVPIAASAAPMPLSKGALRSHPAPKSAASSAPFLAALPSLEPARAPLRKFVPNLAAAICGPPTIVKMLEASFPSPSGLAESVSGMCSGRRKLGAGRPLRSAASATAL